MSARSAVAQRQGATEELLDAVDDGHRDADLTPEQHAALVLADAYLGSPSSLTDAERRQITEHLTPTQIVETVLKLMGFSSDKVMVALGLDLDDVRVFTME